MARENKKNNFKEKSRNASAILKDAKDAIQYFDYKVKFAKNKSYHTDQLNKIIRLNNAFEYMMSGKLFKIIISLALALIRHKLKEMASLPLALEYVDNLMKYPQYAKKDTEAWLYDIELNERMSKEKLSLFNVKQITAIENMDVLVEEITQTIKQSVSWEL